jgi:hypothetical protein
MYPINIQYNPKCCSLAYDVHTLIPTQVRGFNDVIHTLEESRSISTVTTKCDYINFSF